MRTVLAPNLTASLVLAGALVFLGGPAASSRPAGGGASKPPRILQSQFTMLDNGKPGPEYQVTLRAKLQVAAAPGPLKLRVRERLKLGSKIDGENVRSLNVRQTRATEWHSVDWKLEDRFFGIGEYEVQATAVDAKGRTSNPRSKSWITKD